MSKTLILVLHLSRSVVFKARVLAQESQADGAYGTIALFANNDFGGAGELRVFVVNLVAVQKQDHVSILLNRARLAQIGHHRAFVRALFQAAVQLRQRDEVYNSDSQDKGKAEIIIGKQRNGPIGKIELAFRGEYTRFDNLASGSY